MAKEERHRNIQQRVSRPAAKGRRAKRHLLVKLILFVRGRGAEPATLVKRERLG